MKKRSKTVAGKGGAGRAARSALRGGVATGSRRRRHGVPKAEWRFAPSLVSGEGFGIGPAVHHGEHSSPAARDFSQQLASAKRAEGTPLPPRFRADMETRLGGSLEDVRVHTDERAAMLTRAAHATAFTSDRHVFFKPSAFQPSSAHGRKLLAHELTHVLQQRDQPATARMIQRQEEGPQSFAPAKPGTIPVDSSLLSRNKAVAASLLAEAGRLEGANDLRWFFALAHGKISEQIASNIQMFQRPNALLRLNLHFATTFLNALKGSAHAAWKDAFKFCATLGRHGGTLIGETELCGARMANVHINVDLVAALNEVGCIPPQDYGNMLVFVNRGALAALARLRGRALGAALAILQQLGGPLVGLDVKAWRNSAFQKVCATDVPPPE